MLGRLALLAAVASRLLAYSVLTHEAIIDSSWNESIRPLLVARFPAATEQALVKAHAYTYGGAIIQDMGYYPFGSHFFTDLAHYVRSGDFIKNLLAESQDLNEYAFALGALAHYAADTKAHAIAINRTAPMLYPKLRKKFGNTATYEDDPVIHLKTEFGFDVSQVARGRYAPDAYHDFIGFEVAQALLGRAFEKTYSLEIGDVFLNLDLALGTYRFSVSNVVPSMTKVAWEAHRDDLVKANPSLTRDRFLYRMKRAEYEKEWGTKYERPGWLSRLLVWVFHVIPRIGPLRALTFRPPTPEAEALFVRSFDATLATYRDLLGAVRDGRLDLPNQNLDLGAPSQMGKYALADKTYSKLADKLAEKDLAKISPELRRDILNYYAGSQQSPPAIERLRSMN